jgi:hypothetical protein
MGTPLMAFLVLATSASAWWSLSWLLANLGPDKPFALAAFYIFLFDGVACGAAWLAWVLVSPWAPEGSPRRSALAYLGHGVLLALAACSAAWLQSRHVLTAITAFLLFALYLSFELAFVFSRRDTLVEEETWSPATDRV